MVRKTLFALILLALAVASFPRPAHAGRNVSWKARVSGMWSNPANWDVGQVPGPADTVLITLDSTYSVTLDTPSSIAKLVLGAAGNGTQTLSLVGQSLAVTDTSDTSVIAPSGNLALASGGTVGGASVVQNDGGITATDTDVSLKLDFRQTASLTAKGNVHASSITGTGGVVRVIGDPAQGGAKFTASSFNATTDIEITSVNGSASAELDLPNGYMNKGMIHVMSGSGGTRRIRAPGKQFTNQGKIQIDAAAVVDSTHDFNNQGTIELGGGDLAIQLGSNDTFEQMDTLRITPGRKLQVRGGALSFSGVISPPTGGSPPPPGSPAGQVTLSQTGMSLTSDFSTLNADVEVDTSTVSGTYTLQNKPGRTVTVMNSSLSAPITNEGTIDIHGTSSLGSLTGNPGSWVITHGHPCCGGSYATVNTMDNHGTVKLDNTDPSLISSLTVTNVLTNEADGQIVSTSAGANPNQMAGGRIVNFGSIQVTHALTMALNDRLLNYGTVQIAPAESLVLNGGRLEEHGSFVPFAPSRLKKDAGSALLALNGAKLELLSPYSTAAADLRLVSVNNDMAQANITNVPGGTITLETSTFMDTVFNSGDMDVMGTSTLHDLINSSGSSLVIQGHVCCGPGYLTLQQATLNHGTIRLESDGSASATIFVQGALTNASDGRMEGDGTISGQSALVNAGTIAATAPTDTITVSGDLTESATGALEFTLSGSPPGPYYGHVNVTGQATLSGALNISYANGFVPASGDVFPLVTCGSNSGSIATVNSPAIAGSSTLAAITRATELDLVALRLAWQELSPAGTAPSPREAQSAVYDQANDRLIVFGGRSDAGLQNDTWILVNATERSGPSSWLPVSAGTPPAARANHSAVYDAVRNRMIVFGGDDGTNAFQDVWFLDHANGLGGTPGWSQYSINHMPVPVLTQHGAIFYPPQANMVVYGGSLAPGGCAQNDVWSIQTTNPNGSWNKKTPGGTALSPRGAFASAYDPASDRMIVFGGKDPCDSLFGDTWVLPQAGATAHSWIWLPVSGPSPRRGAEAAYDRPLNRLLLFGGESDDSGPTRFSDAWALFQANGLGGTPVWVQLPNTGAAPPARSYFAAAYDSLRRRLVVFGGHGDGGRLNDVWVLADAGSGIVAVDPPKTSPVLATGFARVPTPNPSRGITSFAISMATAGEAKISIFDVAGRRVADLHRGFLAPGVHAYEWRGVRAGIYWVRFQSAGFSEARRFTVLR
jgi:hypothetical protein